MILDFSKKTHGYVVHVTHTDSNGATSFSRIGRGYKYEIDAWLARERLRPQYPDATIIGPDGRVCMPEARNSLRMSEANLEARG